MEKINNYRILPGIKEPKDLTKLTMQEMGVLSAEIRQEIIDTVLKNGGHLASSLGAVEITLAAERVFHGKNDRIIFDVGHQAYAHKLITGRYEQFHTLRTEDGISGFPKRSESVFDAFGTGHASTSISAAIGMARAMRLKGEQGTCVAIIGDSSLAGGEAFEALNDAGNTDLPLVVILNDNDRSIAEPSGALRETLLFMRVSNGYLRLKRSIVTLLEKSAFGKFMSRHMKGLKDRIKQFLLPGMLFEQFGFLYLGPYDGHDIEKMQRIFERAKQVNYPVVIHCVTEKGHLYPPAVEDPEKYHGINGQGGKTVRLSNSAVFGDALLELAREDERIVGISAAMVGGTGLKKMQEALPKRVFDVGICEEHAVTMAAGMACEGLKPVVAIYSTFLQRAYDQIIHDVCLQHLGVVFAVDRAGLTGEDGETHQGIYDLAYLSTAPGMQVYVPSCMEEIPEMLQLALERQEPAAIRYGRGGLMSRPEHSKVEYGHWETVLPMTGNTMVLAVGSSLESALEACNANGTGLINVRFPFEQDEFILDELRKRSARVITVEDGILSFGLRMKATLTGCEVITLSVENRPVAHASIQRQRERYGIDADTISRMIREGERNGRTD